MFPYIINSKIFHSLKKASIASGGAVIGQLLLLLASPILTRLYTPESMGHFGLINNIAMIFFALGCFKYEAVILMCKTHSKVKSLVWVSYYSTILACLLCFICSLIYFISFFDNLWHPLLYAFITTILLFTSLIVQVAQNVAIHADYMILVGKNNIKRGVVTAILQIALGLCNLGAMGLTIGRAAGFFISFWGFLSNKNLRAQLLPSSIPTKKILTVVRSYKDFPLLNAPQNLINAGSSFIPPIIFGSFFGAEKLGQLTLAMMIVLAPVGIFSGFLKQIATRDIARHKQPTKYALKLTLILFGLFFIPSAIFYWIGSDIFRIVFGEKWHDAGVYAEIIIWWVLAMLINPPVVALIEVKRWLKAMFAFQVVYIILRVGGVYYASRYLNAEQVIWVLSLTGIFGVLVYIIVGIMAMLKEKKNLI